MTHDEWVAQVILDINEEYDLAWRWHSARKLAERWWRLAHPLVWRDEPESAKERTLAMYGIYVDHGYDEELHHAR
jgi:hypothetical protein